MINFSHIQLLYDTSLCNTVTFTFIFGQFGCKQNPIVLQEVIQYFPLILSIVKHLCSDKASDPRAALQRPLAGAGAAQGGAGV